MSLTLGPHTLGEGFRPFVIAEMSGNHNASLERALAIVDAAADAGAHAVKLQTYTADTMTLNLKAGEFMVTDPKSLWKGRDLHGLYQEAHTPWAWHKPIMERAAARGLVCFSSPFDESAVDFLESLDMPAYKIASFELVDLPLVRRAARTGKPLIMSTGMASVTEIGAAADAAREAGCKDLVLLKCTSTYPASPENTNLRTIAHLRQLFGCEVGLSDHTLGIGVAVASVAFGACLIEKHFTLARADGGVDSAFSMEPAEMRMLVDETERAWRALGEVRYGPTEAEMRAAGRRRSLYVGCDMKAGEVFTAANLRRVRPGQGLPPKFFEVILGRRIARDAAKGTPVTWDLVGDGGVSAPASGLGNRCAE